MPGVWTSTMCAKAAMDGARGGRVSGEVRKARRLERAVSSIESFMREHGRAPRPTELARHVGIDPRTAAGWIDTYLND